MGALSPRWYSSKIRPNSVRVWLSLGGVNHGTDSLCGGSGAGTNDLCPAFAKNRAESLIQYELNGIPHIVDIDEIPYGIGRDSYGVNSVMAAENRNILYMTVRVASDEAIIPNESAVLDGSGGTKILIPEHVRAKETSPGNILMIDHLRHDGMLRNRDVLELVKVNSRG